MFRFATSAALVAALLSSTALAPHFAAAWADDMPLDSLPFGNATHATKAKKKPAAHVPGVGELVPFQTPSSGKPKLASAHKAHHAKSHAASAEDFAFEGEPSSPVAAAPLSSPPTAPLVQPAGDPPPAGAQPNAPAARPAKTADSGLYIAPSRPTLSPALATVPDVDPAPDVQTASATPAPSHKAAKKSAAAKSEIVKVSATPPSAASTQMAMAAAPSDPRSVATRRSVAPQVPIELSDALPEPTMKPGNAPAASAPHPTNIAPAVATTVPPVPPMLSAAVPAQAPPPRNAVLPVRNSITLEAGVGRVIQLQANTTSVFAADPKVAEVRPASATSLFVFGVAPGRTTVAALDSDGRPVAQYDVTVVPSAYAAGAARGSIGHVIPGHDITVDALGNGVAVRGQAASPAEAERAMAIAKSFVAKGDTASDRININANVQVNLRVRVAEMNRSVTRSLGLNWSAMADIGKYATFSAGTADALATTASTAFAGGITKKGGVDAVIDALETEGMVHSLAEPNLTAMSGETASFLVGGEFPIPVAQQNNQTTIDFKQYGVSLAFVPTVISDGHISLKVRPEVSQLTTTGAVTLSSGNSSFQIPALSVRRAETTVELGSGQSFAIAGLLQDSSTISDSAVPFLGEVPVLGALFRGDTLARTETELVIIVTPYIVRPTSNPSALTLPTDGNAVPNDYERLLQLRSNVRKPNSGQGAVTPTNAGFVVQ